MKKLTVEDIMLLIIQGELSTEDDWQNLTIDNELSEDVIDKYIDKLDLYALVMKHYIPKKCCINILINLIIHISVCINN